MSLHQHPFSCVCQINMNHQVLNLLSLSDSNQTLPFPIIPTATSSESRHRHLSSGFLPSGSFPCQHSEFHSPHVSRATFIKFKCSSPASSSSVAPHCSKGAASKILNTAQEVLWVWPYLWPYFKSLSSSISMLPLYQAFSIFFFKYYALFCFRVLAILSV